MVNLYKMRLFYLSNQIFQTVSVKLTWSHYCELLSSGNANKEKVLALAQIGNEITTPQDLIKNPYVFEFLELPEEKPV